MSRVYHNNYKDEYNISFVSGSLQDYVDIAGKKVDQAEDLKAWLDTARTNWVGLAAYYILHAGKTERAEHRTYQSVPRSRIKFL